MKKILLSCACCLLAVGLLAGCDTEEEVVTPDEPDTSVPSTGGDDGGSGVVDPLVGDYFLGVEANDTVYYFDGTIYNSYYGNANELGYEAVIVSVAAVEGGYTLSFVEDEVTQYIEMAESEDHRNFVWDETPYTWTYNETYKTFTAVDSKGTEYFIGCYGTYIEFSLNELGYLTGEKSSDYAQYPAHLYDVITYNAPTALTISTAEEGTSLEESTSLVEGTTLQLTATLTGTEPVNGKIIWTSSDEEAATVADGLVSAVWASETPVVISATSAVNSSATASVSITITAEEPDELDCGAFRLGVADTKAGTYRWFTTISSSAGQTTRYWNSGTDVTIVTNEENLEVDKTSCIDSDGNEVTGYAFKYISGAYTDYIGYSGSGTNLSYKTEPYYWAYDEDSGAFIDSIEGDTPSGRFLGLQNGYQVLRAYNTSNLPTDGKPYDYCIATLYCQAPNDLHVLKLPEETPASTASW